MAQPWNVYFPLNPQGDACFRCAYATLVLQFDANTVYFLFLPLPLFLATFFFH